MKRVSVALGVMAILGASGAASQTKRAPTPQPSATPKLICHYEDVTGSLAGRVKRCRTQQQAQQQADDAQATARQMQGGGFTCGSGERPC